MAHRWARAPKVSLALFWGLIHFPSKTDFYKHKKYTISVFLAERAASRAGSGAARGVVLR